MIILIKYVQLMIIFFFLKIQRYEGASTIYGPHTLTIYLEQYRELARNAVLVSMQRERIYECIPKISLSGIAMLV